MPPARTQTRLDRGTQVGFFANDLAERTDLQQYLRHGIYIAARHFLVMRPDSNVPEAGGC
ncbi:hypothetical protein [Aminobacter sp. LjRoot7]|uniref:hypothetical protein n=1 Tax=Aminobacter sp. LjRoot7 TaxID=3342335 RepID=UPI003ECE7DF5